MHEANREIHLEPRNHPQHRGVGSWVSPRSNRKPPLYFPKKFFGCMAILPADDQPVVSKMKTSVSGAPAMAFSISRASGMPDAA